MQNQQLTRIYASKNVHSIDHESAVIYSVIKIARNTVLRTTQVEMFIANLSSVRRLIWLHVMVLLVGLSSSVFAQQFTGTVRGTVQDATGAVAVGRQIQLALKLVC